MNEYLKPKLLSLYFFLLVLCNFQTGFPDNWKRVYLATFPRSGNHWARYLIEEASHIATSSVYCDPDPQHLPDPFPWGGFCCDHGYEGRCRYPGKEDLVVVKTHFPAQDKISEFDNLPYHKAIRIVRHPVDSFYSIYVRRSGGNPNQNKVPARLVKKLIEAWQRFQTHWNNKQNVLTIRYEDLLNNPYRELEKILKEVNYAVNKTDLKRAIAKYPPEGHALKHINKFEREDLQLIANELSDLMKKFGYTIPF